MSADAHFTFFPHIEIFRLEMDIVFKDTCMCSELNAVVLIRFNYQGSSVRAKSHVRAVNLVKI